MDLSARLVRTQLNFLQPIIANLSLETIRKGQEKIGELMGAARRKEVIVKDHAFENFDGAWIIPKDERRSGVILYLHGGGYTCGDLEYAKGFGSTLSVECGVRVFCAAYRLAPEHPFPSAPEDVLTAYRYLLEKGYPARQIILCGESAGGGLAYSLCLQLKALSLPLPGGIIAISPWTDLSGSGKSYEENGAKDPSLTREMLDYYAHCYTQEFRNPLCSPLFGDLRGLPPSLIFAGGDEILLDDAVRMHNQLKQSGCRSQLIVTPERWHAYVLYSLKENAEADILIINEFLNKHQSAQRKLRWLRLDNAAKIYPAAMSRTWSNVFRLSATMSEPVDRQILQSALDVTVRRFPSMAARLRHGVFWYYLEQIPNAPKVRDELSYPLARMPLREMRKCAFRVIVYKNRIAVEFFHSLTDGNGGLIFLKSLVAEYIQQRYGVAVPAENGVLGRLEEPTGAEMEDSFLKYSCDLNASRKETTAWHVTGTPEPDGFINLTCLQMDANQVHEKARSYGVSVTAFLCAAMLQALVRLQTRQVARRWLRPVKVLLPVDLRRIFPSKTLRNFALYTIPEIDPRLGEYSFDEICRVVHHHMALDITPKRMRSKIATNVNTEKLLILKIIPLFLKNIAMKAVFDAVGECKSTLSLSNLGIVRIPEVMRSYVTRFDFVIGPQARYPNNCAAITYNGRLYFNMVRKIKESDLELEFFRVLQGQGLQITVESNIP